MNRLVFSSCVILFVHTSWAYDHTLGHLSVWQGHAASAVRHVQVVKSYLAAVQAEERYYSSSSGSSSHGTVSQSQLDWEAMYRADKAEVANPSVPDLFVYEMTEDNAVELRWSGGAAFNSGLVFASVHWEVSIYRSGGASDSTRIFFSQVDSPSVTIQPGLLSYGQNYSAYIRKCITQNGKTNKGKEGFFWFNVSDTRPPTLPGVLSSAVDESGTIEFSWNHATDNLGVSGYYVEFANDAGFNDVIGSTFTPYVSSVPPKMSFPYLEPRNEPYHCRVKAADANGNLSDSIMASVVIPLDPNDQHGPAAPEVRAWVSDRYLVADWSVPADESGVRGYRVQMSPDASFSEILSDQYQNVEHFVHQTGTGLTVAVRVRAQDGKGNWGGWSKTVFFGNTIPVVSRLSVFQPSIGTCGLCWALDYGVPQYDVEVAKNAAFTSPIYTQTVRERSVLFPVSGSGIYHYRVRGRVDGQVGAWNAGQFYVHATANSDVCKAMDEGRHGLGWRTALSGSGLLVNDLTGGLSAFVRNSHGGFTKARDLPFAAMSIAAAELWYAAGDATDGYGGVVRLAKWDDVSARQELRSPNEDPKGDFGWSVSCDDRHLVVGALKEDGGRGCVHVYVLEGDVWRFRQTIHSPDEELAGFGNSVSVSGEWMWIGAPGDDSGLGERSGHCYVYRLDGSGFWRMFQDIGARFLTLAYGYKVAVDGTEAAVGTPWDALSGTDNGGVEIFRFDGTAWRRKQYLQPLLAGVGEKSWGEEFSLSGDWLAVSVGWGPSAGYDSSTGKDRGSVVIFRKMNGKWVEDKRLYAPDVDTEQNFGASLAIAEGVVAVGCMGDSQLGEKTGAIYSFDLNAWVEDALMTPDAESLDIWNDATGMHVSCASLLAQGYDSCEIQLSRLRDYDLPYLYFATAGDPSATVHLVPGTYLCRVRGCRNGMWTNWSSDRFVATSDGAVVPADGLVSEVEKPDLVFTAHEGWPCSVFLSDVPNGTSKTSFVHRGNLGGPQIYLQCSVGNAGSTATAVPFRISHRVYSASGELIGEDCYEQKDALAKGYGFYWGGATGFKGFSNLSAGSYVYECSLDCDQSIDESDETSNVIRIPFDVRWIESLGKAEARSDLDASDSFIKISWSAVKSATQYTVLRSGLIDGEYLPIATVPASVLHYDDSAVSQDAEYFYRVYPEQKTYSAGYAGMISEPVRGRMRAGGADRFAVIDISGGPTASSYPVEYLADVPYGGWTDDYKTGKIVLRRLSENAQSGIEKPFYIGVFEVTQRQWELVMGERPSWFSADASYALRPVEGISYDQARGEPVGESGFINRLRVRAQLPGLDLPTSTQWKYACRAGTVSDYHDGSYMENYKVDSHLDLLGRYRHNSGYENWSSYSSPWLMGTEIGTAVVGSYRPNAWGLYDLYGNVEELGREVTGGDVVSRGGSWISDAEDCKIDGFEHSTRSSGAAFSMGLRLSLDVSTVPLPSGCTVVYDPGEHAAGVSCADNFSDASRVRLRGALFVRNGYTQVGWSVNRSGRTRDYALSETYTIASDKTLYPYWMANAYTIEYALNGGSHGAVHPSCAGYDAVFCVSAPKRAGHLFAGWTVSRGLDPQAAKWGVAPPLVDSLASESALCTNGSSGPTYFMNLSSTDAGSVLLTANWIATAVSPEEPSDEPAGDPTVNSAATEERTEKVQAGGARVDVPVVQPAGAFAAEKARTDNGVLIQDGAAVGILQVKVGKESKGESKVSVTVIGLDGKKYTSKAVKVRIGGTETQTFEVKKLGTLTLTFGANGFSGSLNGAVATSVDATSATTDGAATFAAGDLSSLAGVLTDYLPKGEAVSRSAKKWAVVAKAGKLKYVKPNAKKNIAGGLEAKGSNIAGLKLTYAPKTQTFKGSFKVWTFDSAKNKLKSVSAKVTGVVVNGAGYGQVMVKKDVIGELTVR